ncbi:hypothetical protein ACFX2J_022872 [Malus domestica]
MNLQKPNTHTQRHHHLSLARQLFAQVPPIPPAHFIFDPTRRDSIQASIGQTCRDWGAFHVTNHSLPAALLDAIKRAGLTFFNDNSVEDKLNYACDPSSATLEKHGSWMLENDDTVLDCRDYFDHHTLPLSRRDPTRWPDFPADYRRVVSEYGDHRH